MFPSPPSTPADAVATSHARLPVIETGVPATAEPGEPDGASAAAAIASIRHAVADVRAGRAGAVVTNPIAKSVLYRGGLRASRATPNFSPNSRRTARGVRRAR